MRNNKITSFIIYWPTKTTIIYLSFSFTGGYLNLKRAALRSRGILFQLNTFQPKQCLRILRSIYIPGIWRNVVSRRDLDQYSSLSKKKQGNSEFKIPGSDNESCLYQSDIQKAFLAAEPCRNRTRHVFLSNLL